MVSGRAFIFHRCFPCCKTFSLVPKSRSSAKMKVTHKKMAVSETSCLEIILLFNKSKVEQSMAIVSSICSILNIVFSIPKQLAVCFINVDYLSRIFFAKTKKLVYPIPFPCNSEFYGPRERMLLKSLCDKKKMHFTSFKHFLLFQQYLLSVQIQIWSF